MAMAGASRSEKDVEHDGRPLKEKRAQQWRTWQRIGFRWLLVVFLVGYGLGRYVEEPLVLRAIQGLIMAALGVVGLLMNVPAKDEVEEEMTWSEKLQSRGRCLPGRLTTFVPGAYNAIMLLRGSPEHRQELLKQLRRVQPHIPALIRKYDLLWPHIPVLMEHMDTLGPHVEQLMKSSDDPRIVKHLPFLLQQMPRLAPVLPILLRDEERYVVLLPRVERILPTLLEGGHLPVLLEDEEIRESLLDNVDLVLPHVDHVLPHLDVILKHKELLRPPASDVLMANLELLIPKLDLLLEMLPELEDHLEVLLENFDLLAPVLDEVIEIRADVLPHLGALVDAGLFEPTLHQIRPILRYFPQMQPHLGVVLAPHGQVLPLLGKYLDFLVQNLPYLCGHLNEMLEPSFLLAVTPHIDDIVLAFPDLRDNLTDIIAKPDVRSALLPHIEQLLPKRHLLLPHLPELLSDDLRMHVISNTSVLLADKDIAEAILDNVGVLLRYIDDLLPDMDLVLGSLFNVKPILGLLFRTDSGKEEKEGEEKLETLFGVLAPHMPILLRYLDRLVVGVVKMIEKGGEDVALQQLRGISKHLDLVAPHLSEILTYWDFIVDNMDLILEVLEDLGDRTILVPVERRDEAPETIVKQKKIEKKVEEEKEEGAEPAVEGDAGEEKAEETSETPAERPNSMPVVRHRSTSDILGHGSHTEVSHRPASVAIGTRENHSHLAMASGGAGSPLSPRTHRAMEEVLAADYLIETAMVYRKQLMPHLGLLSTVYGEGKARVETVVQLLEHREKLFPYLRFLAPYLPAIVPQMEEVIETKFDRVWPLVEENLDGILASRGLDSLMTNIPLVIAHLPVILKHIEVLLPHFVRVLESPDCLHKVLLYGEYLLPYSEKIVLFVPYIDDFEPYIHVLAPRMDKIAPHTDALLPHMDKLLPHLDEFMLHIDTLIPLMGDTVAHMDALLENLGFLLGRFHGLLEFESVVNKLPAVGQILSPGTGPDGPNILSRIVQRAAEKLKEGQDGEAEPQGLRGHAANALRSAPGALMSRFRREEPKP